MPQKNENTHKELDLKLNHALIIESVEETRNFILLEIGTIKSYQEKLDQPTMVKVTLNRHLIIHLEYVM